MKLTFYGGARWVTGANYLLDTGAAKILIDCGLFQGRKYAEDLNYQPFQYHPAEIDLVLITHSHIDHIGRLPKLYKEDFRGRVYTTTATRDLMAVALPDNMRRIQEEAEQDGHPALFEESDLAGLLPLIEGVEYGQILDLGGVKVVFRDAGHILGSAIIEIVAAGQRIAFSGDLGNFPNLLLNPPAVPEAADYLVVESAYGDRTHEAREERQIKLTEIIAETIKRRGVLLIPSFAMERTQELLFELNEFFNQKKIFNIPVFLDSPLAINLTAVYKKHSGYFNERAMHLIQSGDDIFNFPILKMTPTVEESKVINDTPAPKIIIAGSGMSHGGRILHHEQRYLSDPNTTILFVGYQVDGSLGRHIQRGDKEVTIFGQRVPINCRIENITSYSGHADQLQLVSWAKHVNIGNQLKRVFVVQGEAAAARTLANLISEQVGADAIAPEENEGFEL
ncbi:MAG: MBL fold metallo-hydrolase [Patescibacteria group bacterium]